MVFSNMEGEMEGNKEALKVHGYLSSESDSSDDGKSEFDLEYFNAKPPVHHIRPSQVIVIKTEDQDSFSRSDDEENPHDPRYQKSMPKIFHEHIPTKDSDIITKENQENVDDYHNKRDPSSGRSSGGTHTLTKPSYDSYLKANTSFNIASGSELSKPSSTQTTTVNLKDSFYIHANLKRNSELAKQDVDHHHDKRLINPILPYKINDRRTLTNFTNPVKVVATKTSDTVSRQNWIKFDEDTINNEIKENHNISKKSSSHTSVDRSQNYKNIYGYNRTTSSTPSTAIAAQTQNPVVSQPKGTAIREVPVISGTTARRFTSTVAPTHTPHPATLQPISGNERAMSTQSLGENTMESDVSLFADDNTACSYPCCIRCLTCGILP